MRMRQLSIALMGAMLIGSASLAVGQTGPGTPPDCSTVQVGDEWTQQGSVGESFSGGYCVFSLNDEWVFDFQHDGNLVIYQLDPSTLIIIRSVGSSRTNGNPGSHIQLKDGNMSITNSNGTKIFQTNSLGHPDDFLKVQDDGGVYLFDDKCNILFNFHTGSGNTTCVPKS